MNDCCAYSPAIYQDGSYVCMSCGADRTKDHFNRNGYDFEEVSQKIDPKNGCLIHEWKRYTGLREQYEYCSKCDKRKEK